MQLNTSFSQRLEQKLIIAPRMIQSMEILQLPVMALQERIEHELQENPVLELREASKEEARNGEDAVAVESESADIADPRKELVIDVRGDMEQDFDRLEAINKDWGDHFNEESRPSVNRVSEEMDRKHDAMVNMASRPQSLQDYLLDQVGFVNGSPRTSELVTLLISHINDRGFLSTPLQEIARQAAEVAPIAGSTAEPPSSLPTVAELELALKQLQTFDPPGVGARDTRECLLLQLTEETPHRELVRLLIQHHLEDIQFNRLPVIQRKTGYQLEAINEAIETLRHLNPRPGAGFSTENVQYVTPDLVVEANDAGEYDVRLLDDWTPNLYISKRYLHLYRDRSADPKAREFLKRKLQAAQWLIEAIEQRRNTLLKVSKAIVKHQRAFLDKGPEFIEPLKMQQIADQVGVHVTTVSRAVDDKWVQTPRGVFPLKRFFGGGMQTASGEEVAWEIIKQKLLDIVNTEDKSNPWSDDHLMKKLEEAGYPIARRTITKYRKMLNIPSSRQRKVWTQ